MIKSIFLILVFSLFISCQKEEKKVTSHKNLQANSQSQSGSFEKDNFDDFKKEDDESCEDEEELKKKLIPEKPKAFQLQGGDAGCDIEALNEPPKK